MTKNPKDHREWTLEEVEEDSQGYLAAQQAYDEERAQAEERRTYEADLKHFRAAFVAAGGEEEAAEAAFRARRNEQAAEAAREAEQADQVAAERSRRLLRDTL